MDSCGTRTYGAAVPLLITDGAGACWGASFQNAIRANDVATFKAESD